MAKDGADRCDRGQNRRWLARRCARPSWRSGAFISVACLGCLPAKRLPGQEWIERAEGISRSTPIARHCNTARRGLCGRLSARCTPFGLWRRLLDRLRRAWRRAQRRGFEAKRRVIDSRSCRSAPGCFDRGIDGGKTEASKSMLPPTNTASLWGPMSRRQTGGHQRHRSGAALARWSWLPRSDSRRSRLNLPNG